MWKSNMNYLNFSFSSPDLLAVLVEQISVNSCSTKRSERSVSTVGSSCGVITALRLTTLHMHADSLNNKRLMSRFILWLTRFTEVRLTSQQLVSSHGTHQELATLNHLRLISGQLQYPRTTLLTNNKKHNMTIKSLKGELWQDFTTCPTMF